MLVIRLQRTGRKGHAQFRVVVQDSRRTPTSGKIVAQIGTYDPHTKQTILNKERAEHYLTHGAQPSERVAQLLKTEGVKLPKWVSGSAEKQGKIRNPEKLRRNQPKEAAVEAPVQDAPVPVEAEAATEPEAPATEEAEQAAE